MNWKSNYKLPLSFIIFFVLMFFLLGEQLASVSTYLGIGPHDNLKPHILDLAPSDALHRPIAYLVFATVSWFLLRFLSWPLVWIITGTVWTIDQLFLVPEPPSEKVVPGVIAFIGWGVLALGPYLLYRWVDKKWGGKGIINAILVVFLINLLLFVFFAYQIYVLHNSYRGFHPVKDQQQQVPSSSQMLPSNMLPPDTCPQRLVEEKDKPTTAYWNGETVQVAQKEQQWVEKNCPGVLKQP